MDVDRACMPVFLLELGDNMVGTLVEGKGNDDANIGENFDFCVEAANKTLKKNLHHASTDKHWMIACRTYNLLDKLHKKLSSWILFDK
jgi:hypothetical protein